MTEPRKTVAVVGVDFEDSGEDAIRAGLTWLAQGPSRELHAVHVLHPSDVPDGYTKPTLLAEADALERVPQALASWIARIAGEHGLSLDKARLHPHVRIGTPADTVLQTAVDYEADLLIVGTHARRGLDRLLLGSVAESLIRRSHCPVLVARPKNYEGATKTKLPDAAYPKGQEPHYQHQDDSRRVRTTESDIWRPTDARPTGFRIV